MMNLEVRASRAEKISIVSSFTTVRLTIKQDNSSFRVHGPSKRDPSFLTSTERDSLFSNLGLVTMFKQGQISLETTRPNDILVPSEIVWFTENDVVLDTFRHAPTFLGGVTDSAFSWEVEECSWSLFKVKFTGKSLISAPDSVCELTLRSVLFPLPVAPVMRLILPLTNVKSGIRSPNRGELEPFSVPQ
jgi:hypothetical protein